jgi:hypothetical protein
MAIELHGQTGRSICAVIAAKRCQCGIDQGAKREWLRSSVRTAEAGYCESWHRDVLRRICRLPCVERNLNSRDHRSRLPAG